MRVSWPWVLRLVWIAVPPGVGPLLGDAAAPWTPAVATTFTTAAWIVWVVALVATLVPRAETLTIIRLAGPAPLAAGLVVVAVEEVALAVAAVGLALGAVAALVALAPSTADHFVDASSYGDERRVALRVPAPLLFGPVPIAWLLLAAGVTAGPLVVAGGEELLGGSLAVTGATVAWLSVVRIHQLSRRWLVFVPAGVVIHDPLALADPVLLARRSIERVGLARPGSDGVDLSQHAAGLLVEIALGEPVDVLRRERGAAVAPQTVQRLLIAPARPGATLKIAADRRIPVG